MYSLNYISEFGYSLDQQGKSGVLFEYGLLTGNATKMVEVPAKGAKSQCALHCITDQCKGFKIAYGAFCIIYK